MRSRKGLLAEASIAMYSLSSSPMPSAPVPSLIVTGSPGKLQDAPPSAERKMKKALALPSRSLVAPRLNTWHIR